MAKVLQSEQIQAEFHEIQFRDWELQLQICVIVQETKSATSLPHTINITLKAWN